MRPPKLLGTGLLLLASIGHAGPSLAADPPIPAPPLPAPPLPAPPVPTATGTVTPPASAEERSVDQQVIELFDKGTELYRKSQWAEAELSFQAAWNLKRSYDIAGNLGEVELKIGQVREAAEHLAFSVRQFPPTGREAHRKQIQQFFEAAKKEVVSFRVRVNVDGAQIFLNGSLVGNSPLTDPIYAEPGKSLLEARLSGHETAVKTVESAKGWTEEVEFSLTPKAQPPSGGGPKKPVPGETPGGEGFLEGKSTKLIIGGAALTAATLVAGAVLTVAANGKSADAATQLTKLEQMGRPCSDPTAAALCDEQQATLSSQSTLSNLALSAFVVSGVSAAATAVYILWPVSKSEQSTAVRPVPAATAGGGGLWLRGTF